MAEFATFGAVKTYKAGAAIPKNGLALCLDIMRAAEKSGKVTDPTYLECKRRVEAQEAATGKKLYFKYTGLPTSAYFGKKLGPMTKTQTTQTQKTDLIFKGTIDPTLPAPDEPPTTLVDPVYTNGDTIVDAAPLYTPGLWDRIKAMVPSWWPWGLAGIALIGGGFYVAKQRGMVHGLGGFSGMTPQQAKFKAAAKSCKGKPGYRACMSRKLRK